MTNNKASHSGKQRRANPQKGDSWFTDLDLLGIKEMRHMPHES
jgi:hypothetical protein